MAKKMCLVEKKHVYLHFVKKIRKMKKVLFFIFTFSILAVCAQHRSSVETRALQQQLQKCKSVEAVPRAFLDRYPIRMEKGVATVGVMARVDKNFDAKKLEPYGIRMSSRVSDIVCLHVPLTALNLLEQTDGITYYSVAHHVAPMMDKTRLDTRTDSVQAGLGVPMPFNGEGVLIGITDWGFDYTHPNINPKSSPRIVRAWDQFKLSGPAPEGLGYGTEYVGDDTIRAAKGDTSGLYGYGTHGTHVAGICGGIGKNGKYIGQAPGAKYLLGSWYLDEVSWLDQVAWMKRVAQAEGKRLVINSSWGMYTFSTLDGTSLLSQSLNAYSDSGIVFVTSAGNNGDAQFHLQHSFGVNDTLKSIATYLSSGVGQALIYWGEVGLDNGFEVGFALMKTNDNSDITYSPLYSTDDDIALIDTLIVVGEDTIHYDLMTERSNALDGRPHALLNVEKNSKYRLVMVCTASEGAEVHIWNVGNVANKAGNTGCDFVSSSLPGLTNGDRYYGIGEPACAEKTLSVAAHNADHYYHDTVYMCGPIAYFSSFGPTLDGRQKPDFSAPGVSVVSSISSWADGIASYDPVITSFSNGRNYIWSNMSGTSMSSPAVTGIVALMLQANPNLTFETIYEILTTTARNDDQTGALHANDSASLRWGYGKVNALKAVNAAYDLLGIDASAEHEPSLVVFPNPTNDRVTVRTGSNRPERMELYTIDGRMVGSQTVTSEGSVDLSRLVSGVYFIRIHDTRGVRTAKIVKR